MREINNIKKIQEILFKTLCYFDNFCKQHDIKYFLSNGTLLGAAKYGDFIPGDDDVDVIVPRKDYDRLVKMIEINNGEYKLFCREQIKTWRMPYAKLSYERTLLKEGEYNFGASFGLSLDIFPIDNWNSNLHIAKIEAFNSELMKRCLINSIGTQFQTRKKGFAKIVLAGIWCAGKILGYKGAKLWLTFFQAE